MTHHQIQQLILQNERLLDILTIIKNLELEDCWLAAGTLRNFLWNYLSDQPLMAHQQDVDVVFFDPKISYQETLELEAKLKRNYPEYPWELKNEVYMHQHNPGAEPYLNSQEAISKFPETCTAIAARLLAEGELELFLPYGAVDLLNFEVRPTPFFKETPERMAVYRERVAKKDWQSSWTALKIFES
ncbi:nucleotidyltransferase family protein [Enterococcus sp. HY326]|uniref:nucleotidyltransferase family protein n=1 Tax=Enterococcus sp. HY326 TaxID=2971265 RepID=UPI00223EDC83|nr:nucleotidyltransferase family protein [Enterococcus sp. HY326]